MSLFCICVVRNFSSLLKFGAKFSRSLCLKSLSLGELLAKSWSSTLFTRLLSFKFKSSSPLTVSLVSVFAVRFFFKAPLNRLSFVFVCVLVGFVSSFNSFLVRFVLAAVAICGLIIVQACFEISLVNALFVGLVEGKED